MGGGDGMQDASFPSLGIPMRLTKAAWRGRAYHMGSGIGPTREVSRYAFVKLVMGLFILAILGLRLSNLPA